jgi:hypothetical protein
VRRLRFTPPVEERSEHDRETETLLRGRKVNLGRYHLRGLVTEGQMIHDTVLDALYEQCLSENRGRTIVLGTEFMKQHELETSEWLSKIGRTRWERLTVTGRLLLPMYDSGHFSLLDLDLRNMTAQHHDSLDLHVADDKWVKSIMELGTEILKRKTDDKEENFQIKQLNPNVTLQQQDNDSNTCLIHTFNFITTILRTGNPLPLEDQRAISMRKELAAELWRKMEFVGHRVEGGEYPGESMNTTSGTPDNV